MKRIVMETPSGARIELDEETSAAAYDLATKRGVPVIDVIRDLFERGYAEIMAKNN